MTVIDPMDVAVVGAGSWGTTIAAMLGARGPVTLWARSAALAEDLATRRVNDRYLPGLVLPSSVRPTASLAEAVSGADVVLLAVPSHGMRAVLSAMAPWLRPGAALVSLAKGIEADTNLRMSEVIDRVAPGHPVGVLSGPNLAHEVASGHPAATVVAMGDAALARRVQALLHCATFRVYTGADVVGCEIAGATKNVIAIAAGVSDGVGFGENTRATLVTRGLAEQARLGLALGGRPLTFGGLAGVGDLVATAEGVRSAEPLVSLARARGVEMPIAEQVAALVGGRTTVAEALAALMERPARAEWAEWDDVLAEGLGG
jgi:glycerol-3-phosphate dehydrogenase (NAD(P)+)